MCLPFTDAEHSIWFTKLQYVELAISTIVNVSTNQIPFMLVHGIEAWLPIDLLFSTLSNIYLP